MRAGATSTRSASSSPVIWLASCTARRGVEVQQQTAGISARQGFYQVEAKYLCGGIELPGKAAEMQRIARQRLYCLRRNQLHAVMGAQAEGQHQFAGAINEAAPRPNRRWRSHS